MIAQRRRDAEEGKNMKINTATNWGKTSRLRRKIGGFILYITCALFSLVAPETVDYAIHGILKDRFIEP